VTKTVAEGSIRAAVAAGCQQFRENRVQEAKVKWRSLADSPISWSISGHLQTNKVKDVVAFGQEFQALDSIRVAEAMFTTDLARARRCIQLLRMPWGCQPTLR
jgi:PLP dependent protein